MATLERTEAIDLSTLVPGAVTPDARPNYEGWIVQPVQVTRGGYSDPRSAWL